MRFITPVLVAAILIPLAARAQEAVWRPLFNGADLTGWRQLNGDHIYEARGGEIVGTTVPGQPNGFLVTEEEFGDFILELEVRVDPLMNNSGIQFRSLSLPEYDNGRVHGYQAEIDTKPQRWSGSIYDEARRGWLYTTEINPEAKRAFINNTWNHYRIEAIGTSNRVWVNGIPTSHLVDGVTLRGFIGLQLHANNPDDPPGSHQIRFRNIRIRTENLEPSPYDDLFVVNLIPNTLAGQERAQGFRLLWDGRSLAGWSGSGWSVEDGMLRAATAEVGALVSDEPFMGFELKFDFKPMREGAACGIRFRESALPADYCAMALKKVKADAWNQGVIRVHEMVEYWLNGYKILEYRNGAEDGGRIRLEPQGGDVAYRSIRIREL